MQRTRSLGLTSACALGLGLAAAILVTACSPERHVGTEAGAPPGSARMAQGSDAYSYGLGAPAAEEKIAELAAGFDRVLILEREPGRSGERPPRSDYADDDAASLEQPDDLARRVAIPGSGEMLTVVDDVDVRLPLESTDVRIDVLGPFATGAVRQRFGNPYDAPIEAVYVFPLPQDAAVHDFVLTIGERKIRGIVREREEARRLYEAARSQGYTAALLSQERPNVFTQNVANIAPGHSIDVEIAYLEPVDLVDGWQEIAFPMVVGPRYNPVGWDGGIGAVAHASGAASGQPTDVHYLRPNERSGHDIALTVTLNAGLAVERIESPSHAVTVEERRDGAVVRLSPADAIPNADFRLRWRTKGEGLRTALVRQDGHAVLTLYPPDDLAALPRRPMEHVFVLDTSGSMQGEPLAVLKRAMRAALGRLAPDDSFHVLHFSNATGALAPAPLPATAENLRRARQWLDGLKAGGGTEMVAALAAALQAPSDGVRPRVITFLTDGQIGNEEQMFTAIQAREEGARIFAFGIGSSPNRWLMSEIASRSGGADAYVGLDEDPARAIEAYFERTSRPAVQELRFAWSGASATAASDVPRDLLIGRPLTVPFALEPTGAGDGPRADVAVTVQGRVDGAWRDLGTATASSADDAASGTLAKVWARARLAQLTADSRLATAGERGRLARRMTELALEHGLVSSWTSFIAVDSAQRVTDGGDPARVDVAVPVPAGVSFETTVSGG